MRLHKYNRYANLLTFIFFISLYSSSIYCNNSKDSLFQIGLKFYETGEQFYLISRDSIKVYMELSQPYFEKAESWEYYVNCFNNIAFVHYYNRDFNNFDKIAKKSYHAAKKYLRPESEAHSLALTYLGLLFEEKGDYEKSIGYYKQSLVYYNFIKDYAGIAANYQNIGNSYQVKGDFDEALTFFQKSLSILEDTLKNSQPEIPRLYIDLANCFMGKEDTEKAIIYYKKALTLIEKSKFRSGEFLRQSKVYALNNLTKIYIENDKIQKALPLAFEALNTQHDLDFFEKYVALENLGKIYQRKGELNKAIVFFKKAIEAAESEYNTFEKHPEIAGRYATIGNAWVKEGEFDRALEFYQIALEKNHLTFLARDSISTPGLKGYINKPIALDILKDKAGLLYQIHQNTNDEKILIDAFKAYQMAVKLTAAIRQDYITSGSKLLLSGKTLAIYEGAIETANKLFQLTGQKEYLESAFGFAENNKANLLLESVREMAARGFGGIPDSLLEKEKNLRFELSFYEKQINIEKQKGIKNDIKIVKPIESKLFILKNKWKELIEYLEKQYPKYHQLKYDDKLASIKEIQTKILEPETIILEYFFGEKNVYVFSISKNEIEIYSIKTNDNLSKNLNGLLSVITMPPKDESLEKNYRQFTSSAHELYKILVEQAINKLSITPKKLIIIPDDKLCYIPFEVLLKTPPVLSKVNYSPLNLQYLIHDYQISYNYSTTLLLSSLKLKSGRAKKKFIGLAPYVGSDIAGTSRNCFSNKLNNLPCSEPEVLKISAILDGDHVLSNSANRTFFQTASSNYQILHMATHACLDEVNPMLNKIFFADDFISNYDLSIMQLNADLVVLSACNTGSGVLRKGEGVMSLSKGFYKAGCPSLITSLWSVDDCATSEIMVYFYNNLVNGKNKDESLQQAKLSYLESVTNAKAHPYYWAAFIQTGKVEALFPSKNYIEWGLIAIGLILGIWIISKLTNSKQLKSIDKDI